MGRQVSPILQEESSQGMRLAGVFQLPSLPCNHPMSHGPVWDVLEGPSHPKSPRTQLEVF